MELTWDTPPKNGTDIFFSRESYEKYSLAPTLSELWHHLNREGAQSVEQFSTYQATSAEVPESKPVSKSLCLPEPRVPFPRLSSLSEKEQRIYLTLMRKCKEQPKRKSKLFLNDLEVYLEMKNIVTRENAEFMKYLQNAAKMCAEDYNMITDDAIHYTKAYFRTCMERVKKYPMAYRLNEVTSIMGGKFNPELKLKLEKNILALGTVAFAKIHAPPLPSHLELTKDYSRLLALYPPEKMALKSQPEISSDSNIEKLAVKYNPHVALTSQALVTLLNNLGPNYSEGWTIPITVKVVPTHGDKLKKVICIDSPFLKKEMTIREKFQIFHEAALDFFLARPRYLRKPISKVLLEKLEITDYRKVPQDCSGREYLQKMLPESCPPPPRTNERRGDLDIDFENDLIELETFGEASSDKKSKRTSAKTNKQAVSQTLPGQVGSNNSIRSETARSETAEISCQPKTLSAMLQKEKQLNSTSEVSSKESVGSIEKAEFSKGSFVSAEIKPVGNTDKSLTESDDASVVKPMESVECDQVAGNSAFVKPPHEDREGDKSDQHMTNSSDAKATSTLSDSKSVIDKAPSTCHSDSEDEQLVIDVNCFDTSSSADVSKKITSTVELPLSTDLTNTAVSSLPGPQNPSETLQLTLPESIPEKNTAKRSRTRVSKEFDPVGQILKMQSQLLRRPLKKQTEQLHSGSGPSDQSLSSVQAVQSSTSAAPELREGGTLANMNSGVRKSAQFPQCSEPQKSLLSSELQSCREDESQYVAPQENAVYKLFSLDDLLLLVSSSVYKVQTRTRVVNTDNKYVPVYMLPKLEYQACHGVEALTDTEMCHLWTESIINSSTKFYIGHIDAFTSDLIMLEQESGEEITTSFGTFKPTSSLNVLHNLLKKVSDLQEGFYLLNHTAGDSSVTIFKSTEGVQSAKVTISRATYNLHEAYSTFPQVPSTLSVPWVPLNPSITLPYHIHFGRVPCTFPPRPSEGSPKKKKVGVARTNPGVPKHDSSVSMETSSSTLPDQSSGSEVVSPAKKRKTKSKGAKRKRSWKAKTAKKKAKKATAASNK
ncbi:little elongation complex subunit 2 [Protopterus annectens]|uniref:little elongation complex subunit 2 n=1 Tax=Protopterus annectens TaxID=7888 RepID=UPI001CFBCE57|nr:little elongation complex subunit 2 [Protopterus annectens]